jgi:hypothetical protein
MKKSRFDQGLSHVWPDQLGLDDAWVDKIGLDDGWLDNLWPDGNSTTHIATPTPSTSAGVESVYPVSVLARSPRI